MTTYCAASDLTPWIGGTALASTTKVTDTQALAIAAGHSAIMDSKLEARYTVPITGTNALVVMKTICTWLTAADVNEFLDRGLGSQEKGQEKPDLAKRANDLLLDIVEGRLSLTDASLADTYDFANSNVDEDREFTVQKDEDQW